MLTLPPTVMIYVATAPVDLRKQFDGIALLRGKVPLAFNKAHP